MKIMMVLDPPPLLSTLPLTFLNPHLLAGRLLLAVALPHLMDHSCTDHSPYKSTIDTAPAHSPWF